MAFIRCEECRSEISNKAESCPRCGAKVAPPAGGHLESANINLDECRALIDDYMRAMLYCRDAPTAEAKAQANARLDRIDAMRQRMPEQDANDFMDMVMLGMEALKLHPEREAQRLGVGRGRPVAQAGRQSMGNLVVTTAVRATVWESVRAIFRSFR